MDRYMHSIGLLAAGALAVATTGGQAQEPAAHVGARHAEEALRHWEVYFEGVEAALATTGSWLEHFEVVALPGVERQLEAAGLALEATAASLEHFAPEIVMHRESASDRGIATTPPAGWLQGDPGDSLYQAGRTALNRGDYRVAARTFEQLRRRFPRSGYVPDSYYWEAFARNRLETTDQLRTALALLETQAERYADAATARDGRVLATRIRGVLARRGDAEAAEEIAVLAAPPEPEAVERPEAPEMEFGVQHADEEDDIRVQALMALLQMDAENAIPVLRQVMERRDPGSTVLRRRAVFIISQKRSEETMDILLDAARNDPDAEVRRQAVFFLSQVRDERAADALADILETSDDPEMQQAAAFALSQHPSERAAAALRTYAGRDDVPEEARAQAIFVLGQHRSAENQAFLRDLYGRVQSPEVKAQILHAVSQSGGEEAQRWMLEIAMDRTEDLEARKQALFWAGQNRNLAVASIAQLYDTMDDLEIRQQVLFVLSQRGGTEAVDKLMDIARNDPNEELRRQAIFWLGQSRDPRVAEFLLEIINR